MSQLKFQLFGKFTAGCGELSLKGLDAAKERELLSYLLIHRDRPHPREALAALLWGDTSTAKSKKYLRQVLWRLQTAAEEGKEADEALLIVEHDWVQINRGIDLWLDVAVFEKAVAWTQDIPGKLLDTSGARALKDAVELYRGDLLDGWYQDWCLFERERLQNMYLSSLDKLIMYCEQHHEYDIAMDYGARVLSHDRARERTHRQLMYVRYMAGDRTGALRQYESCVTALDQELGVKPERRTLDLYRQISTDRFDEPDPTDDRFGALASSSDILGRLRRLQQMLARMQNGVRREIKAVKMGLRQGSIE